MNIDVAAAHLIAKHLRTIAALVPQLSPEGLAAFTPGLRPTEGQAYSEMLSEKADRLEAAFPFEPVHELDKREMRGNIMEQCVDMTAKDNAENVYGDWTEAEWRMEKDDYDDLMRREDVIDAAHP